MWTLITIWENAQNFTLKLCKLMLLIFRVKEIGNMDFKAFR